MIPWYMIDIDNFQIYTSELVPEEIQDDKSVILTETPIYGLGYQPVSPGGNTNRIVNFSIPVHSKAPIIGNSLLLKFFKQLRTPIAPLFAIPEQHSRSPKVLYNFGTGDPPAVWYCMGAKITSKGAMVNDALNPEYSMIEVSLLYDAEHELNIIEDQYSAALSAMGSIQGLLNTAQTIRGSKPL